MIQEYKKHSNAALQNALIGSRYGVQQLLQMVNMPPAELQNLGVDEKTMQLLETHEGSLQRLLQEQRVFVESVQNNAAQNAGHGDQNGAMSHRPPSMGPSPPFGSQQPQQTLLAIAGRTQLQHHLMQQQGALQSTIANSVDTMMGARMRQQMPSSLTPQGPMGGNTTQSFAQSMDILATLHGITLRLRIIRHQIWLAPAALDTRLTKLGCHLEVTIWYRIPLFFVHTNTGPPPICHHMGILKGVSNGRRSPPSPPRLANGMPSSESNGSWMNPSIFRLRSFQIGSSNGKGGDRDPGRCMTTMNGIGWQQGTEIENAQNGKAGGYTIYTPFRAWFGCSYTCSWCRRPSPPSKSPPSCSSPLRTSFIAVTCAPRLGKCTHCAQS